MAVSYNRLWKLLIDKKMSKASLRKAAGIAPNTMTKLSRDETVTPCGTGKNLRCGRIGLWRHYGIYPGGKNMINIRKLETELWESADLLRAGSKLTSNQYCMPVLGLFFCAMLTAASNWWRREILKDRPMRGGRVLPVEASDFASRSALFLPREAQYAYLINLPGKHCRCKSDQLERRTHDQPGRSCQQRHGTGGTAERTVGRCAAQNLHHVLRRTAGRAAAHLQ